MANVFIPGTKGDPPDREIKQKVIFSHGGRTKPLIRVIDLSGWTVHFWAGKNWTEGEGEKGAGHDSSVNLDCTISTIDHVGKVESAADQIFYRQDSLIQSSNKNVSSAID